jgi:hypothetical protein
VFDWKDKHFAVADLPGFGRAHHHRDSFLDHVVCEHDFDFHLGQKINGILAATINFGVSFLPAKASFTSSSLKGLMIASSFFIAGKLACACSFANQNGSQHRLS